MSEVSANVMCFQIAMFVASSGSMNNCLNGGWLPLLSRSNKVMTERSSRPKVMLCAQQPSRIDLLRRKYA